MTALVQLTLAFASIILVGTLAAWLYDTFEALRLGARVQGQHLVTAGFEAQRACRILRTGRAQDTRILQQSAPGSTPALASAAARRPTSSRAAAHSRPIVSSRPSASSRSTAPHGGMSVTVRRLGSQAVDA